MSYQLHCPNCSTMIPPDKINIEKTLAACPNCGAVFDFSDTVAPARRSKRRKSKQPDYIEVREDDESVTLEMPMLMTTSYRLGMPFLGLLIMAFLGLIVVGAMDDPDDLPFLIFLTVMLLPFAATLFGSLFAKQRLRATPDSVQHEVRLGVPVYRRTFKSDGYVDAIAEETSTTRESTMAARYNLFAERYDGKQELFLQNAPEEMAQYAQQTLANFWREDPVLDGAALNLRDEAKESDEALDDMPDQAQQRAES